MLGLYVHIPFCSIKCYYCDFAAFAGQSGSHARYLKALEAEAGLYAGIRPRTLYIGGGTPSELGASELAWLFSMLASRFGFAFEPGSIAGLREATFEANPESLDAGKLDVLEAGGISRLSLGLQTASNKLLKAIGRKHSWEDFLRVFRLSRERSFDVSVDLMFGLPGQSYADAMDSLRRAAEQGPQHISLYSLQVEDRTLFGKREVEVDEDLAREVMEASIDFLESAGFRHYEISNFARPGKESLHNMNYWQDGPYLGLGCGAAGFLGGERYQNEDRLEAYCKRVEQGARPAAFTERLTGKEKLGETLMLGLRRIEGLELSDAMLSAFGEILDRLKRRGLIRLESARHAAVKARLTREGIFLANEVFRQFVAPFDAPMEIATV